MSLIHHFYCIRYYMESIENFKIHRRVLLDMYKRCVLWKSLGRSWSFGISSDLENHPVQTLAVYFFKVYAFYWKWLMYTACSLYIFENDPVTSKIWPCIYISTCKFLSIKDGLCHIGLICMSCHFRNFGHRRMTSCGRDMFSSDKSVKTLLGTLKIWE